MAYLLLIVEDGVERRSRPVDKGRLAYDRMARFTDSLRARGVLRASDSLRSDSEGVRVRVRDGKRLVVDGPFTESKEIVGGFFFIDCRTRGEALAIANECPAAEWATVELREVGPCYGD